MLAGWEANDGGEMQVKSGAKIIYLPQQPEIDPENTVLQQVLAYCGEQMQLILEYEDLSHRLASVREEKQQELMAKLATVTEKN